MSEFRESINEAHRYMLEVTNAKLEVYDNLIEHGVYLPEEIQEDITSLLDLQEFYARQLGINDKSQDTHSAKKESE